MTQKEYHRKNTKRTGPDGVLLFSSRDGIAKNFVRLFLTFYRMEMQSGLPLLLSFNNTVKGMTEDTAKRSIDWLHSIGSRVFGTDGWRTVTAT